MIRAAFFDLDGTLVNTLNGLKYCMNEALKQFGYDEITDEQARNYVGSGIETFTEMALKAMADRLCREAADLEKKDYEGALELEMQADDVLLSADEVCSEYMKFYKTGYLHDSDAYPGMRETLSRLKDKGIKLACITNKPGAVTMKTLDAVFGRDYFDYVVSDDGTVPLKPDPSGCLMAIDALGVKPDEVIYIGDTSIDMETAGNARLISVGCLYGFRTKEELVKSGAAYLINKPEDLIGIVEKL